MEDETHTTPPPPTPPPLEAPEEAPPLRRSRSDRVIAGVCGGIGQRFGVDPVIVRIAWVALTLFGGSGVILYLIAWVVMAKEGEAESSAMRTLRGREHADNRGIAAIVILLLLILIVGSPFGWLSGPFGWLDGGGLVVPLLLIAAGITLLVWRDPEPPQTGPPPPPDFIVPPVAGERPRPPAQVRVPRDRRRSFLTPLTLAALLVITGGAVALGRADVLAVDPAVFLAICLTLIGVVLTLSAFFGRARGLILIGILLLPLVWWFHAVDLTWWDGIGEQRHTVTSISQLEPEYRLGIGQLVIDLTGLDLAGTTRDLAVGATIGEVVVLVPDSMNVDLTAGGRIGEIRIEKPGPDITDDGFDVSVQTQLQGSDGGTLVLDLQVGIGSARVEVR